MRLPQERSLSPFHLDLRKGTPATREALAVMGNCGAIGGVQYPSNCQTWRVIFKL
ncbi:hypothetical protein [Scytonema sp. HK-05]|uniref:hypothetical protein n=1 Tax=Scytonema sp. HK-05 TaxID=1137095 RepID=UPI000A4DBC48|nr:hypothetical protein [Scytonema sp. HK-05]